MKSSTSALSNSVIGEFTTFWHNLTLTCLHWKGEESRKFSKGVFAYYKVAHLPIGVLPVVLSFAPQPFKSVIKAIADCDKE